MFEYTPEEIALAKAVIAAPADDLPRTVMADKLDENAGSVRCSVCVGNCGHIIVERGGQLRSPANAMTAEAYMIRRGNYEFHNTYSEWRPCTACVYEGVATGWEPDGRAARADFIRVGCQLLHAAQCLNCRVGLPGFCFVETCRTFLKRRMATIFSEQFGRLAHTGEVDNRIGTVTKPPVPVADGAFYVGAIHSGVYWWRGFVDFVRCHFAEWYGHVSPRLGAGFNPDPRAIQVEGIGPELAALHPIAYVDCPDKVPHWNGRGYAWYTAERNFQSDGVPQAAVLPSDVFVHFKPFAARNFAARGRWFAYPTSEQAREAFSVALLKWGRRLFEVRNRVRQ